MSTFPISPPGPWRWTHTATLTCVRSPGPAGPSHSGNPHPTPCSHTETQTGNKCLCLSATEFPSFWSQSGLMHHRAQISMSRYAQLHLPLKIMDHKLTLFSLNTKRSKEYNSFFLKEFLMWTIFYLYWTCYNIASVLCFGFLAPKHVKS